VSPEDEIMLITTGGVLIRMRVAEIRELGRSTQGVRLINLGDNEALAGVEKIQEPEEEANGDNGGAVNDGANGGGDGGPAAESGADEPGDA
jgi:DNA gyrase subunit A